MSTRPGDDAPTIIFSFGAPNTSLFDARKTPRGDVSRPRAYEVGCGDVFDAAGQPCVDSMLRSRPHVRFSTTLIIVACSAWQRTRARPSSGGSSVASSFSAIM